LVEIFSLSRCKLGIEIGWVLEEGRIFQDFHPEIGRLAILAQ
jgi:hypothetical protein